MRISAFGDLHLDSAFAAYGLRNSSARREMLRNIFSNIISAVKENGSDLLLICGDLFDIPTPTPESETLVINELSSLNIPVFITPGNHDYYTEGGVYDRMPKNVFVFKTEALRSVFIDSLNVCIDGYAFLSDTYAKNPLASYTETSEAKTRILCAHTDMNPSSKYAPFSANDLKSTSYTFAALGHVHTMTETIKAGNCTALYSGVMQGRGPDEPLNGYLNVIDIENGNITSIEQVRMSLWDNLVYQISADGATSDSDILKRIRIETESSSIGENDVIRFELVGEHGCYYSPNITYILTELKKMLDKDEITLKNASTQAIDRETLLNDPSVAGVLYRALFEDSEFVNRYPEDVRVRAFRLSMKALRGDDIDPESI